MQKIPDKQWWQKGWTIPVSVILHFAIVGVFFLQFSEFPTKMAEPESISVDLVPPEPEPPPPPPEPEQKQPEEQPPPPPPPPPVEEAAQNMPSASLTNIPLRPEPQQEDAVDNPAASPEDEASVAEDPAQPEEKPTETATEPSEKPVETAEAETASTAAEENPPPSSDDGELAPPDPVKAEEPKKAEKATPQEKTTEEKKAPEPAKTDVPKKLKNAKKLLSDSAMKNPAVRSMLGDLPPKRRIVQMCSIEALAQIRATRADSVGLQGVVPASDTGGFISGNALDASGGAFNIDNRWYDITFHCEVDLDNFKVTSFRFDIGKTAVPQADAVKRGLSVF